MEVNVNVHTKRVLCTLFCCIFLTSCSQSNRQWQLTSNEGSCPIYQSSRLYLAAENNFSNLEVDIFKTSQGFTTYVNACGLELQPEGKNQEGFATISVTIHVEDQPTEFEGLLLQGGHRILLPADASNLMVEALQNDKKVEMSVAHYSTTIISDEFKKHYQKLTD